MPFAFLAELQRKVYLHLTSRLHILIAQTIQFLEAPSSSSLDDPELPAYGLQGSFAPTIANLVNTYNTAPPVDEIARARSEIDQVKDIMVMNVEQILSRGERIELLVDKTDVMAGQATAFRRGARNVRRQMWWKNKKILCLSILVALVSWDI